MNAGSGNIGHGTGVATQRRVFLRAFVRSDVSGAFLGGRSERTAGCAGKRVAGKGRRLVEKNLRGNKSLMRGQAMILALAALFFLVLMTLGTYNLAQMTHSKTQTLNAADAGAYAAATVTARHANFMAYSNRAMVANHVFVGQTVSLISFAKMLEETTDSDHLGASSGLAAKQKEHCQTMSTTWWVPMIPGIPCYYVQWLAVEGAGVSLLNKVAEQVPDQLDNLGFTTLANKVTGALSKAQLGSVGATGLDAKTAAEATVKTNDPDLEVNVVAGVLGVAAFLAGEKRHSKDNDDKDGNGMRRVRKILNDDGNDSTDEFTRNRKFSLVNFNVLMTYAFVKNTGGTALGDDNETWLALDGSEARWSSGINCSIPVYAGPVKVTDLCIPTNQEYKSTYSAQGAITGNDDADEEELQPRPRISSRYRSSAYDERGSKVGTYDGLRDYSDRKEIGEGKDTSLPIIVKVSTRSGKFDKGGSTPDANSTFETGKGREDGLGYDLKKSPKIESISAAEVYFRQPAGRDGDRTAGALISKKYRNGVYASYFSPYWQARLVDPAEKMTDQMKVWMNLLK
jgi:hypothetical protein